MRTKTESEPLLTQTEAARIADVDRTTIRAWTQAGMPYKAPSGRGEAGGYAPEIVLHWMHWNEAKRSLPDLEVTAPQAIALGHAWSAGFDLDTGDRRTFEERVVGVLAPFYSDAEALSAAGYARGVFAGRWSARRAA